MLTFVLKFIICELVYGFQIIFVKIKIKTLKFNLKSQKHILKERHPYTRFVLIHIFLQLQISFNCTHELTSETQLGKKTTVKIQTDLEKNSRVSQLPPV